MADQNLLPPKKRAMTEQSEAGSSGIVEHGEALPEQSVVGSSGIVEHREALPEQSEAGSSGIVEHREALPEQSEAGSSGIVEHGEAFYAQKLKELKKEAFYSALYALVGENLTVSKMGTPMVERLMQEFNISQETQTALIMSSNIRRDRLAQEQQEQQRVDASKKQVEIVEEKLLNKPETLNPTIVATSSSKWGSVYPVALVGKYVRIRMPLEDGMEEFFVKEYDSRQDMHLLEPTDPNAMEMDDGLKWCDVTQYPRSEIVWEGGISPNFGARPNQGAYF